MERIKGLIFLSSVLLMGISLFASGFALFEHSTKGMGMGGAFVARADDATAVYYNPAGITQLEKFNWSVGVTPIQPVVNVSDMSGNAWDADDSLVLVPSAHITYQMTDKLWLGAGIFAPFGLATTFDENWAGRYNSHNAEVEGLNLNVNLAYKVNDKLSVAVGIDSLMFDVLLEQKILPSAVVYSQRDAIVAGIVATGLDPYTADLVFNTQFLAPSANLADINQEVSGNQTKVGFNLAVHFQPNDKVKMGISYRSGFKYDIAGEAKYRDVTPGFILPMESIFFDAPGNAKIELPEFLYFGLAYAINEKFDFEVDLWQTAWSSYDKIDLTVENGVGHAISEKDWSDVWALRMGTEYRFSKSCYGVMGYVYDESPIPDELIDYTLPSNDRQVLSFGVGYKKGNYSFDASYGYLVAKDRHITARPMDFIFESDIDATAHLFSIGMTYKTN